MLPSSARRGSHQLFLFSRRNVRQKTERRTRQAARRWSDNNIMVPSSSGMTTTTTISDPVLHQEPKQSTCSVPSGDTDDVAMDETLASPQQDLASSFLLADQQSNAEAAAAAMEQRPTTTTQKKERPQAGPGKPPRSERKPRHKQSGKQKQRHEVQQNQTTAQQPQPQPQRLGKKALRRQLKRQLEQQAQLNFSPAERFLQRAQAVAASVPEAVRMEWPPSEQFADAEDDESRSRMNMDIPPHQHATATTSSNATPPPTTQHQRRIEIITSCLSPRQLQQQHERLQQQQQQSEQYDNTATTTTTTTRIYIKPLLVLDLNGILCHRIRRPRPVGDNSNNAAPLSAYRATTGAPIATTPVVARPHLAAWLEYLQRHFCLAVWTSGKNKTARALVRALVPSRVRFLFVWAQHHCLATLPRAAAVESDSTTADAHSNNGTENGSNSSNNNNNSTPISATIHPSEIVYQKDLGRVWKEFPLWNASNTILLDDSPDKCAAWSANAVHPPRLNGLRRRAPRKQQQQHQQQQSRNDDSNDKSTSDDGNCGEIDDDDDEANVARQQIFFDRLVQHWVDHPVMQEWDATSTAAAANGEERNGLVRFLREHAVDHMGWEA